MCGARSQERFTGAEIGAAFGRMVVGTLDWRAHTALYIGRMVDWIGLFSEIIPKYIRDADEFVERAPAEEQKQR